MPIMPRTRTSRQRIDPDTLISLTLQPPKSLSLLSSDCQLGGAQKSLKTGPAWKRIIASPPLHGSPGLVKVLPVTTNRSVPSLATPPCPQMPPPMAFVAQAMTLEGLLIGIPITHPWYMPHSAACPANVTERRP